MQLQITDLVHCFKTRSDFVSIVTDNLLGLVKKMLNVNFLKCVDVDMVKFFFVFFSPSTYSGQIHQFNQGRKKD